MKTAPFKQTRVTAYAYIGHKGQDSVALLYRVTIAEKGTCYKIEYGSAKAGLPGQHEKPKRQKIAFETGLAEVRLFVEESLEPDSICTVTTTINGKDAEPRLWSNLLLITYRQAAETRRDYYANARKLAREQAKQGKKELNAIEPVPQEDELTLAAALEYRKGMGQTLQTVTAAQPKPDFDPELKAKLGSAFGKVIPKSVIGVNREEVLRGALMARRTIEQRKAREEEEYQRCMNLVKPEKKD